MTRSQTGFTLIELLMTLAVMMILMVIAVPSMAGLKQRTSITATHNRLVAGFSLARQQAVTTAQRVTICPGVPEDGCRTDGIWENGWIVFVDQNGNAQLDAEDILLSHENKVAEGLRIHSGRGRPRSVFRPDGSASGTNLTLRICTDEGVRSALVLSNAGRVRSASTRELAAMTGCG